MFETNPEFDFDEEETSKCIPGRNKRSLNLDVINSPHKKLCIGNSSMTSDVLLNKLGVNRSVNTKIVSRKFPGPAGLLPQPNEILENDETTSTKCETDLVCSQMSVNVFHEGPWERMIKDFQMCSTDFCLPEKYNIAWIKNAAKSNKLINKKAPFLAGIIENMNSKKQPVLTFSFVLKDVTGSIQCTITMSSDPCEDYLKVFKNGNVIVLKQFGVLTNENDSVFITTTANNLLRIYTPDDMIIVQEIIISDFIQRLKEIRLKHKLNIPKFVEPQIKPVLSLQKQFILPCSKNLATGVHNLNLSNNQVQNSDRRKFNFKQKDPLVVSSPCKLFENCIKSTCNEKDIDQIERTLISRIEQDVVLESVFEGIDTDALFEDF